MSNITSIDDIKNYITGGKAEFTIQSLVTGKHYTYRAKLNDDKPENSGHRSYFIYYLTGSNDGDWSYLCILRVGRDGFQRVIDTKSSPAIGMPVYRSFRWFIDRLNRGRIDHTKVAFLHSGKCSVCGRKLTHPESIRTGMGDVCRSKL